MRVGSRVRVVVSDPWELYEPAGGADGCFAVVRALQGSTVLLYLDVALCIAGKAYRHVLCNPRRETGGECADDISGYSCTAIPPEHVGSPFDITWWRGGAAFLGALYPL